MTNLSPLESIWKEGRAVRDVAINSKAHSTPVRGDSIGAVGVLSLIGPFHVERFAIALQYIRTETRNGEGRKKINPFHILSQPWIEKRAKDSLALREGAPAPFIEITAEVEMPGWPALYVVSNGMHRSYAARRNRDKLIDAEVRETWLCDPSRFYLSGTQLVHRPSSIDLPSQDVPQDVATILECLGCERENDDTSFSFSLP